MAKDSTNDIILKLAAIVGGAWLAAEIIKSFSKEETVYSCPVCNADISYGETPCHNCHSHLNWPEQIQQTETKTDVEARTL